VAAAYLGKTALVSGLLQKDEASVSTPNLYLGSALRCAAMQGHYDTTRALLDVGADVNYCRLFKDFALGAAAFRGHRDVVELLLQPEYNCVLSGAVYEKAICRAARGGNLETMLFMIKRGKVEDSEDLIQTILGEAAGNGHESVVQWALENGALVHGNIDKLFQKSALNYAALNGHEPIVRLLL
ncbi:ankyrin, partial [Glonium stellatum]